MLINKRQLSTTVVRGRADSLQYRFSSLIDETGDGIEKENCNLAKVVTEMALEIGGTTSKNSDSKL